MNSKNLLFTSACLISVSLYGQAKLRKFPANINHTSISNFAPYISLDGNTMVYVANVAEDNELTMSYTVREGVNWKDPITMPKSVNNRLNFLKGYAISTDGKTLYISNQRSNGIGGFDLYTSQLNGSTWTEPANMLLPANSKLHDACPSLSADGMTMFYMRCEKMDYTKADNCKIMMMTKKLNGQWDTPVELPAPINTGNSQTPRIMGDGETLLFSSNKFQPNKGGMDLYLTKFTNGQWGNPIPLDFANTAGDDQYVSATSLGRYLVKDAPGPRTNELIELLFPAEIRPKGVMKIEGVISGLDDPSSAFITVFNLKDQRKVFSTKPGKDGTFFTYIKEGGVYDLSVDPEKDNYIFFSKTFDLTGEKFSLLEKVNVSLKPAQAGDDIALDGISFKPGTAELTPSSAQELRRLTRLIQGNSGKFFSIMVTLAGYEKDSVRSNPDLTEVIVDTLKFPVTYKVDSITTGTRDSIVLKTTYHNDRTLKQAKAIGDYLTSQGIPGVRLSHSGKAQPEAILENRKTKVNVIIP
jgi:WD40-like Beta Propeller Repeat